MNGTNMATNSTGSTTSSTGTTQSASSPTTTGATMAGAPGAPVTPSQHATPLQAVPNGGMPLSTETTTPGSWKAGFSDDLRGYMDNKGFKDPAALAEAYRNFEKLQGVPQDKVLKLPDTFYDDAGKLTKEGRAVYEKMGAPKELTEYNFPTPKEGVDPKMLEHFKNVFHENGIPKSQAEKIVGAWNEYQGNLVAGLKEAQAAAFRDGNLSLQKDWGMAFNQNTEIAKTAVRTLGLDAKHIDAIAGSLGHAETMKLFHKLGQSVGESRYISGMQPESARIMDPNSARTRRTELMNDKSFVKRFSDGDGDAIRQMQRLNEQIAAGAMINL